MIAIPLQAEIVFHIGSWPVSNAFLGAFLSLLIFLIVAFCLRRPASVPGRFQAFVELLLETLLEFFDRVTQDRQKSKRFLPIAGTLFFFILISNWMGLLPGFGEIGVWHGSGAERELIPLLRSANSDLNLTVVMALVSVIGSHLVGIVTLGFWTHGNKFLQFGSVWKALKTLNVIKILTALVEFVVGIIELFSELAKVASLSLRLFGNVFAGEVLLSVITSLIAYFVPLPFIAMEFLVGIVQATVFAMLTLVYLTVMTMHPHGSHDKKEHATEHPTLKQASLVES